MVEQEDRLSLLSIEVLISHVQIDLKIECHLPCVVFRLLDYPAVSIPYFDQWQVEEFHNLKKTYPHLSWRHLLSDQFYELRSANGKFSFKSGKSCLFKTYFKTLRTHLLNVPLFLLLIDQINDHSTKNTNSTHFLGSCNVKLDQLIDILHQSIIKHGNDTPLVEQQTFQCTLFNLMGTSIGTCDLAVRFCHYGTTILTQLPMLDEGLVMKKETETIVTREQATETLKAPSTDAVVRHIHIVNEKKDVGLQLSRSDLPRSAENNKSAQTRWTSTKTRTAGYHHAKGRYLRAMEDPSEDDSSIASYRPPPLYFNSQSDFLQMITPATTRVIDEAKENRLSYLASIPIASFDEEVTVDEPQEKQQPKRKIASTVRFHLPASSANTSRQKITSQPQSLTKDFLSNFPLLRSLVEEALALQQQQSAFPISVKQARRPSSVKEMRSLRPKSVIVARTWNSTRRLYPPVQSARQMVVTKTDVRDLVNRLSKPKPSSARVEHETEATAHQTVPVEPVVIRPRRPPKSTSITTKNPSPSYATTRAHRLFAEFSRARRAAHEAPAATPVKPQTPSKKIIFSKPRILTPSPERITTETASPVSLLNKVDVDTTTLEKNIIPKPSSATMQGSVRLSLKDSSTISQDASLQLNQTLIKTVSSTPDRDRTLPEANEDKNDDLNFSITDITD